MISILFSAFIGQIINTGRTEPIGKAQLSYSVYRHIKFETEEGDENIDVQNFCNGNVDIPIYEILGEEGIEFTLTDSFTCLGKMKLTPKGRARDVKVSAFVQVILVPAHDGLPASKVYNGFTMIKDAKTGKIIRPEQNFQFAVDRENKFATNVTRFDSQQKKIDSAVVVFQITEE